MAPMLLIAASWANDPAPSATATAAPAASNSPGACPEPANRPPLYPPDLLRRGKGGTVLVDLATDGCGRVVDARIKRGSGVEALDQAALAAARLWVLTPEQRAKQVDGRIERELSFAVNTSSQVVAYAPLNWPKSHRRPRYELEPMDAFATPREARAAMKVEIAETIQPPYPMQSTFFRNQASAHHEYWMFIYRSGVPTVAARYRLVGSAQDPVVKLAMLCEGTTDACDSARAFLLRGFPFAKAAR